MDKNLDELKNMVVDVWTHGLFGVDIGSIIIALGILLSFLLIRGIFSKFVLAKLHDWAAKSTTKLDDKIVDALIDQCSSGRATRLYFRLQSKAGEEWRD